MILEDCVHRVLFFWGHTLPQAEFLFEMLNLKYQQVMSDMYKLPKDLCEALDKCKELIRGDRILLGSDWLGWELSTWQRLLQPFDFL